MKKYSFFLVLVALVLALSACGQKETKPKPEMLTQPYSKTEFLMGTVVTVKIYDKGKEAVLNKAFDRITKLADEITVNDTDSKKSEIEKVNAEAGKKPVKVTDDIFYLVQKGLEYSENSHGSFDITVGPITELWHIGFPDAKKPSQSEINTRLPQIDYKNVEMNKKQKTIYLKKPGMALDLGGNIYVLGDSPKGGDWKVGIQDPFSPRGNIIGSIPENNRSIVTSGIYERFLEVDGKKYYHILNPRTGYPYENDIAGVSIISKESIDGDGLSTATFSKGIKEGLNYIEKFKGVEAIFVSKEKKVYITSGLKKSFKLTNKDFTIAEMK